MGNAVVQYIYIYIYIYTLRPTFDLCERNKNVSPYVGTENRATKKNNYNVNGTILQ